MDKNNIPGGGPMKKSYYTYSSPTEDEREVAEILVSLSELILQFKAPNDDQPNFSYTKKPSSPPPPPPPPPPAPYDLVRGNSHKVEEEVQLEQIEPEPSEEELELQQEIEELQDRKKFYKREVEKVERHKEKLINFNLMLEKIKRQIIEAQATNTPVKGDLPSTSCDPKPRRESKNNQNFKRRKSSPESPQTPDVGTK